MQWKLIIISPMDLINIHAIKPSDQDASTHLLTGIWSIMEQEKVYVEVIEKN